MLDVVSECKFLADEIRSAGLWNETGSCEKRTHLISPVPFALSKEQIDTINKLGNAILAFYKAVNDLYLSSDEAWAREYLDIGKPDGLIRQAAMKYQKKQLPAVIRPDILITKEGLKITELDSVPGGIGHLDCLSAAYENLGFNLIPNAHGMRDSFADMIKSESGKLDPVCAVVVSDESADYLPEMSYMAQQLRNIGLRAYTLHPRGLIFDEEGLYANINGSRVKIDILYRFFELFDQLNIPKQELISYAAKKKLVIITPPYKHYFEEKILLSLFHNEALSDYWHKTLGNENFNLLKSTISPTYIMDNRPVPPHAEIAVFKWNGRGIRDWKEISNATQKERRLVLKPSGFSPLAWGARGVVVGHDKSRDEWAEDVNAALNSFSKSPYVLQPFYDTSLYEVKYFDEQSGEIRRMDARIRLCAYYFVVNDNARLGGVLATACPKNKKLIHGMIDAVICPCCVENS